MTRALDEALKQAADISVMSVSNLLINGFHSISQENGTNAVAASQYGTYNTDQHALQVSTDIGATGQQVASPFPSQPAIMNGVQVKVTTALASPASGSYLTLYQPIEGYNLARLQYGSAGARPVTVAFMARSSIALVGYFSLRSFGSTNRSFAQRFTLAANTDTLLTFTIPGDVAQALNGGNAMGLYVSWNFGCGSGYQGAAGSWVAGNVHAASDVTNLAAAVGNTVTISGAVMIPGRFTITQDMLPLLQRRYDDELRLCLRYYQRLNARSQIDLGQYGANGMIINLPFKVPMRAQPSMTIPATGVDGATLAIDRNSPDGVGLNFYYSASNRYPSVDLFNNSIIANARM